MNIVYFGADVPSNRLILEQMNVTRMGVSFWSLTKRGLPKTKKYLLENYFKDNVEIYVHPGIPQGATLSEAELEEFCADYEEFVIENLDRITLFTEVDHAALPAGFKDEERRTAWHNLPEEKFAAVYSGGDLESLATRYYNVVIPNSVLEESPEVLSKMRSYSDRHGTKFHAFGVAKPDLMRNTPFTTMGTLAWLSPMMRGETIVWHSNTLTRYPKRMKDQARSRYKAVYEQARLDFDKILADDAVEVTKLALWSYAQLENWNNRTELVTMSDELLPLSNTETSTGDVTNRGVEVRKQLSRNPDEIRTLPVFGVEVTRSIETNEEGIDVLKDVSTLRSSSVSVRACNTCFIRDNCPAFKVDSSCAFSIPVEVKTRDQLKSVINTILEIQGQRVLFTKYIEDMNGGYPDPNVGQEMDRFFKMLESIKKMDDSKEMIRVSVERQGSSGVLSALFGDKAQVLNELPNGGLNEQQINQVIKDINPDL